MTKHVGPLYEINFIVAADVIHRFDDWLARIVARALPRHEVATVRALSGEPLPDGRLLRTCQFLIVDDPALDLLRDDFFVTLEAEAGENFSDQVTIENRTLRIDALSELSPGDEAACLNCGTQLKGQYCGHCGQRSRGRMISIWELLRDAFGDLFEFDSRLWRTLVPLLARPGQLTRDYLEGRRARYMPPFRTYLVLSVIFFVVAFFEPNDEIKFLLDLDTAVETEQSSGPQQTASTGLADDRSAEILADEEDNDSDFFDDCENASISDEEDAPEWIKKRLTDDFVKKICENNQKRGSENFIDAMLDGIPIALIVLLPLMALVLKLLYPLSRRYFVEHLLFFVHFHAFFFLMLTLQLLFANLVGKIAGDDSALDSVKTLTLVVASFYIPVYLYKAMRRVYGQGHLVTICKYLTLLVAYFTGASLSMAAVVLIVVISA